MAGVKERSRKRWLLIVFLAFSSIIFSGCEKGSLGVKSGAIKGYVMDKATNKPIADVLVHGVTGEVGAEQYYRDSLSGGDGSFLLSDLAKGAWTISWSKFGWVATGTYEATTDPPTVGVTMVNGETSEAPILFLAKTSDAVKGTLKGYPVDSITGTPLQNFTISQVNPSRYKIFEMAEDFKEAGWAGLEGGDREYKLTCENYQTYNATAAISNTPYNLGVMKVVPETVSIQGTIRNLPGYILSGNSPLGNAIFWVESSGKVVASGSANPVVGTVIYSIAGVPVTAGNVAVKCKVRGYDIVTINPSLSIPKQRPTGSIAGVDVDFSHVEPIRRDVRVVIRGSAPSGNPGDSTYVASSMETGEVIRVYCKQGGKDIVPYVDVTGTNQLAEAYFTGLITGYPLEFLVVNTNRGYISNSIPPEIINEDGNTIFTINTTLSNSGT